MSAAGAAAIFIGTSLMGCGGGSEAITEANPVPLAGYYEGTYTFTREAFPSEPVPNGVYTRSGVAQLGIMGPSDRIPPLNGHPAIGPGDVRGAIISKPEEEFAAIDGQMTGNDSIKFSYGTGGNVEGTLTYDPITRTLTGTLPVTRTVAEVTRIGTLSLNLAKRSETGSNNTNNANQ